MRGEKLVDRCDWFSEIKFPWRTRCRDKSGRRLLTILQKAERIKDLPGWKGVLATCFHELKYDRKFVAGKWRVCFFTHVPLSEPFMFLTLIISAFGNGTLVRVLAT